ncbi:MAG TPA: hypothetical protein VM884_08950 [Flavisolibacter sp.]|nr:hypothetical protein [Flavisolibacter sp.]
MSGFPILDLVVGIIFIFFLLSIISSSAVELILTGLNARSKILGQWLVKIFDKEITQSNGTKISLGQSIMDHCATTVLTKPGTAPSYIDAKNFTSALIEKLTYDPENPKNIAKNVTDIIRSVEKSSALSTELQRAILSYAYEAKDTYDKLSEKTISEVEYFRAKVENWYDTSMNRLTGSFKKKYARPVTLFVATVTAITLNADSIAFAKYLYSNPEARAKLVAQAEETIKDSTYIKALNQMRAANVDIATINQLETNLSTGVQNIKTSNASLADAIPFGWKSKTNVPLTFASVLSKITGLLATILAIFMGAPFWFDILNKIANMRGTGRKPASSADEGK